MFSVFILLACSIFHIRARAYTHTHIKMEEMQVEENAFELYFGEDEMLALPAPLLKYFTFLERNFLDSGWRRFDISRDIPSGIIIWQAMIDIFAKHEERVVAALLSEVDRTKRLKEDIDSLVKILDLNLVYSLLRTSDFYLVDDFLVPSMREVMRRLLSMTPYHLYIMHRDILRIDDNDDDEDSFKGPLRAILPEYTRFLAMIKRILRSKVYAQTIIDAMLETYMPHVNHLVAVGVGYSIVITSKGVFYSGTRGEDKESVDRNAREFRRIQFAETIVSVATGKDYTLFTTQGGKLYSIEHHQEDLHGELGRDTILGSYSTLVPLDFVRSSACGKSHSVVLTADGVFSFGKGESGQLGNGQTQDMKLPTRVLLDVPIIWVGAGDNFSAFLSKDGEVYLCGSIHDRLKHGSKPIKLSLPAPVSQIVCLVRGIVVLLVDGTLYAYGDNTNGMLGIREAIVITKPTIIPALFSFNPIKHIFGGQLSTIFVATNDVSYLCGYTNRVEGHALYIYTPKLLVGNLPIKLIDVAIGVTHTLILMESGLYGYGSNDMWQLGDIDAKRRPVYNGFVGLKVTMGHEGMHFEKHEKPKKDDGLGCHFCGASYTNSFVVHPMSEKLFCDAKCFTRYTS